MRLHIENMQQQIEDLERRDTKLVDLNESLKQSHKDTYRENQRMKQKIAEIQAENWDLKDRNREMETIDELKRWLVEVEERHEMEIQNLRSSV